MNRILCILLFIIAIFSYGCSNKDCGTDTNCFKESFINCTPSKVNIQENGNTVRVTVRGEIKNYCKVSLKLEEAGNNLLTAEEAYIAKGKAMNCNVNVSISPEGVHYYSPTTLKDNYNQSCQGPLKDIIKSSHDFNIISNLGTIYG